MILVGLIGIPFCAGFLAWWTGRFSPKLTRWIALLAMAADLALVLALWAQHGATTARWWVEIDRPWIETFGIHFHLGLDGLSLVLVALTAFLGLVSVAVSWTEITERVGAFHFNLLWVLSGIIGVFLALDLFLFYFFWELMLIPMYFLIALWGHERRVYASIKFFAFTQASGLLMLVAILALYVAHGRASGTYTFDYDQLLGTPLSPALATWTMLGFFVAFAVKLPVVPLHTWLPDAHTEAPTAGSVVLAGLLLKTGAYGLLRFVLPLFPQAAFDLRPVAMVLGVVGIVYGAWLAFAQTDLKRLVAYTSVSHMGFVLLGVFAWNALALQGVVLQIVCHGLSTGALFIIAGALQERIHTREMNAMGGLWDSVPRFGAMTMIFAMASLGLPGLGNFVAEFLVLLGVYRVDVAVTAWATVGLVAATVYSLWIVQQAFHGTPRQAWKIADLNRRELAVLGAMVLALLWLGLYPRPLLKMTSQFVTQTESLRPAESVNPTEAHVER